MSNITLKLMLSGMCGYGAGVLPARTSPKMMLSGMCGVGKGAAARTMCILAIALVKFSMVKFSNQHLINKQVQPD